MSPQLSLSEVVERPVGAPAAVVVLLEVLEGYVVVVELLDGEVELEVLDGEVLLLEEVDGAVLLLLLSDW